MKMFLPSQEILTREVITQQQPDTRHSPRNLAGESSKTPQALPKHLEFFSFSSTSRAKAAARDGERNTMPVPPEQRSPTNARCSHAFLLLFKPSSLSPGQSQEAEEKRIKIREMATESRAGIRKWATKACFRATPSTK
ncbi:hypothetical protein BHM03_00002311 [Ensete ventricosum]|nr:hypothetical protein BHM03_00002311 [Ensete ventricosum]